MKWPIKFFLLALAIPFVYKFCEKQTDGFRISRLSTSCHLTPMINVPKEVQTILNQRFHYLASGGQSWVFVSDDQKYVLKFFKTHLRNKKGKLEQDFKSCQLAYETLKEETGLIYLHLHQTATLYRNGLKNREFDKEIPQNFDLERATIAHEQGASEDHNFEGKSTSSKTDSSVFFGINTVQIVDKLHIEHSIDLNNTDFLLQKKGVLLYQHLQKLMEDGDLSGAKKALSSLCQLIVRRCEKGVFDEDARIHCNLGFVGNQPILLDTGRFKWDERRKNPEIYRKDLKKITLKLKSWLESHYPQLLSHLEKETAA